VPVVRPCIERRPDGLGCPEYAFDGPRCPEHTRQAARDGTRSPGTTPAPAVGDNERKRIGREIRRWQLHRWSGKTLTDLARSINVIVQGWINYYGRFYRSELVRLLKRINEYLVRWARWKYKRLRRSPARARRFLAAVFRRQPDLFAHWRFGARPDGWTMGAG
jgi:RNA-directed DNA polymerase